VNPRTRWLLVAGVVLTACHPTPGERATVRRWLLCEECKEGERDSVVALGDRAIGALGEAVKGPPASGRENIRRQAEAMYARLSSPPLAQQVYARHFVDNYVATYQSRAAIALGLIGTPRAQAILLKAARNDTTSREDVLRAIGAAAPIALAVAAGDSQSAPADSTVRIDPSVLVTDVRDSAAPRPLADVRVVFRVESGGGRVGADSVQRTDASGKATVRWQLGSGRDSINVLRAVAAGQLVEFHAIGRGPDPRAIFVVQPVSGTGGQPMDTIRVAAVDPWGNRATSFTGYAVLTMVQSGDSLLRPVAAGVADFTGVVLHLTGIGLRLNLRMVSTSNPNTPVTITATSDPFDLTP